MKRLLAVTLSSTLLITTGCESTPYTKQTAENSSTTTLCTNVYHSYMSPQDKQIAKNELTARGMDWRSIQCEQAANDKRDRKRKDTDETIRQGMDMLKGKPYGG